MSQTEVNLLLLRAAKHLLRATGLDESTWICQDLTTAIKVLSDQTEPPSAG